jgi:hypothetical protein
MAPHSLAADTDHARELSPSLQSGSKGVCQRGHRGKKTPQQRQSAGAATGEYGVVAPAPSLNRYLSSHVRSQASVAWDCALAPHPAADNVSARGCRHGSDPPEHLNPLRCSLTMRSPPLPHLKFLLRLCTPSSVSSRDTFLSITLCLGTPSRCMGSVLVLTTRFASPGHRPILLGGTPLWNAAGAVSSISSSVARLTRLRAWILLICGLIFWICCLLTLSRLRTSARRCMLTLLTLRMSAVFAYRGSWILSASCPVVPALFLLLCAWFSPGMSCWLGRLLLMRPRLLVIVCLLLVWCTVACAPSRCHPLPVLPGVAHPPFHPMNLIKAIPNLT